MNSPGQHPERRRTISWRPIALFTVVAAIVALGLLAANLKWRRTTTNHTEPPRAVAAAVNSDESSNPAEQRDEIPNTSDVDEVSAEPAGSAALSDLNIRLGRDPDDIEALIERGVVYYRRRDLEKSEADLALAAKLAPRNPRVWATYGYLQELRQRSDDAVAAYDKAISLGSKNVEILGNRAELRRKSKQYTDAIADWTTAIESLPEEVGSARERVLRSKFYYSRGCTWAALGRFDEALRDFEYFAELEPELPFPRAEIARVRFAQQEYEKFTASMLEAIRLNPDDAGQDYEPVTDRPLSAEAVKHGEEQVRKMLNDRPALAEHIVSGDEVWTWAVRKFAGEDTGTLVHWNASDPSPFEADSGNFRNDGHAQIRVAGVRADSSSEQKGSFERLWRCVVIELHKVAASETFRRIFQQALDGQISREEYILAICTTEDRSKQRTRAFYLKLFLPWMRSKNLSPTSANNWYCFEFFRNDLARKAFWQRQRRWGYNSAWFDVLRARSAFERGDHAQMIKHLAILDACQGSLTSNQLVSLQYWKERAAQLRGGDERSNSKAKSENPSKSPDTQPTAVPQ